MKQIKLTQGQCALVSDKDSVFLNQWKWFVKFNERGTPYYAVRMTPRPDRHVIRMHRIVLERMGFKNFPQTDHRDGNGLNNQRRNLRPATNQQNSCNQKLRKDNTTGLKGICWDQARQKWLVQISANNKRVYSKRFNSKQQAIQQHKKHIKKYHGKFNR